MLVLNIAFYLLVTFTVFLVVGSIYEWIKRKRLVKDMSKRGEKYYIQTSCEIKGKETKYYINYFLLKPEWYEKVKATKSTTYGFNIDMAYVKFAEVNLMNDSQTTSSNINIPCYKLRRELEQKDLELLQQIKEFNISDENYAILKADLEKQLKEKELLKDY